MESTDHAVLLNFPEKTGMIEWLVVDLVTVSEGSTHHMKLCSIVPVRPQAFDANTCSLLLFL